MKDVYRVIETQTERELGCAGFGDTTDYEAAYALNGFVKDVLSMAGNSALTHADVHVQVTPYDALDMAANWKD